MARVDPSILEGLNEVDTHQAFFTFSTQDVESYSGFLTVDKPNNGNMFFWFFPAEENPESAPVVIWLQVGPGAAESCDLCAGRPRRLLHVWRSEAPWSSHHLRG